MDKVISQESLVTMEIIERPIAVATDTDTGRPAGKPLSERVLSARVIVPGGLGCLAEAGLGQGAREIWRRGLEMAARDPMGFVLLLMAWGRTRSEVNP